MSLIQTYNKVISFCKKKICAKVPTAISAIRNTISSHNIKYSASFDPRFGIRYIQKKTRVADYCSLPLTEAFHSPYHRNEQCCRSPRHMKHLNYLLSVSFFNEHSKCIRDITYPWTSPIALFLGDNLKVEVSVSQDQNVSNVFPIKISFIHNDANMILYSIW